MKILLILMAPQYLRPFVRTVQELAVRGHEVRVAWHTKADSGRDREEFHAAFGAYPSVSVTTVDGKRSVDPHEVALARRSWNYLRYLDQPYRGAVKLRHRAFDKLLRVIAENPRRTDAYWPEAGLVLTPGELERMKSFFAYVERLIPTDPVCDEFVRTERPDAILLSPLVDLSSSTQADFAKSALGLGVPLGMLVYSWDNLSTKGGLHVMPDRVFVWNQRQRSEAMELHGVPRDRIVVTGAPRFDPFLACTPRLDRAEYCKSLGLDPAKPVVTYVCSSEFVTGHELPFVQTWLRTLRTSSSSPLHDCNLVVRPHPDIPFVPQEQLDRRPDRGFDDLLPAIGRPFGDRRAIVFKTTSRTPQGLFECLWHSDAVVGLNTSAEIEAGILGRPVLSILAPETTADGQQSTLHFHYLRKEHGGFVEVAASLREHATQLASALAVSQDERDNLRRQALRFVRPHGRKSPVYELLASAIERELLQVPAREVQESAG